MKRWRESPPDVFVVDLSRLPSHGREIAIALRQSPKTREVPILFFGGPVEKVTRIRSELPDAIYCSGPDLCPGVSTALATRGATPVRPAGTMERYSARTAAQKLGIQQGSIVALVDAPRQVAVILSPLPPDVELVETPVRNAAVTLCFVAKLPHLESSLSNLRSQAKSTKLWVVWPKGGSAARGDITSDAARETGKALGLVDYKICSVNAAWSAMLFAYKR